jgi:hypothetical protein
MPMQSTNRSMPSNRPGQDATTRDRGQIDYFNMRNRPNKAKVEGSSLTMYSNIEGMHSRRAPKVDILR